MPIRQPIVVVLGHVDHGKTTLLDKIRGTTVATREPGAISQHIGASFVPASVLQTVCGSLLVKFNFKLEIPGLLFIDTPGHSAFANLRKRGGSVADIAILVIDLMQGVQPQTIESMDILRARKTPFIIAANKLDITPGWRPSPGKSFIESLGSQEKSVQTTLDEKIYNIVGALSYRKFQSERLDRVKDFTKTLAIVPVSAKTGEGLPDLLTIVSGLTQQHMKKQLALSHESAKGSVLEVREDTGLGVNLNAIIYDGTIHENEIMVVGGKTEPIITRVKALLLPKPLDEIRDPREKFKRVKKVTAAAGIKIVANDLENAVPGAPIYCAKNEEEAKDAAVKIKEEIESIKVVTDKLGIIVKTDTLGSLEAIMTELQNYSVPVRIGDVGDISKRDVTEATVVKSATPTLGSILGFNVKLLENAHEESLKNNVKIFQDNIIYHLIENYLAWVKTEEEAKSKKTLDALIRPGKIRLIPGFVFRRNDPAVFGIEVLGGVIRPAYSLIKENGAMVGKIFQLQDKGENIQQAGKGMQIAVSMKEPTIGRQIREGEILYVNIPEDHVKTLFEEYGSQLSTDEITTLKEFIAVVRKTKPYFAFSIAIEKK